MLIMGKSNSFTNSINFYKAPVLGTGKTRSNKPGACHSGIRQPSMKDMWASACKKSIDMVQSVVMQWCWNLNDYWDHCYSLLPVTEDFLCTRFVAGRGGGALPGPETGLLSNTWKWIVWGDTCADKARDFIGKGPPGGEQWGRGTQENCSATWLTVSGCMVMGLVSGLSLASHSNSESFLVAHASLSQDGC